MRLGLRAESPVLVILKMSGASVSPGIRILNAMSDSPPSDPGGVRDAWVIHVDHAQGMQVGDHGMQDNRSASVIAGRDSLVAGRDINVDNLHVHFGESKSLVVLDQGPYLQEKRDGFTGREWLFERVRAWAGAARSESALLIVGEPGIGKSAFIAELAHRNPDGRVIAYHFCTREDRLTLEPGAFVSNLAAMLASRLPLFAPVLEDSRAMSTLHEARSYPGQALDLAIISPLSRLPAPAGGACLILVDGLDEAMSASLPDGASADGNIVSLLASRADRLPSWLRVIATARRDRRTSEELAGLRADVIEARDDENVHDLARFVGARVRTGRWTTDPATVTDKIVKASDGNFLYAKSVLRGLERGQSPVESLNFLPPAMSGFYGRQFRRLLPPPGDVAARPILEALVAAQAPLDLALIASAAAADLYEVTVAISRLSEFIRDRDGGLVLFHQSLVDWLTDPQSSYFTDPHRGHERLAADFVAAMDVGPQPQQSLAGTPAVAYRGRYGLHHLAQAGVAVSGSWNPWVFATTALSAGEYGHALGTETDFVPIFAQTYVTSTLAAGDLAKIVALVLLSAHAARARYHDAGILRINVSPDGTWTRQVIGDAHDRRAVAEALTLSAWAGAITNAAVTAYPHRTQELAPAVETLAGLGYLGRGLEVAGWASRFGFLADRGDLLGRELAALSRTNEPWQPEEDHRLGELIRQGVFSAAWHLWRSPAAIRLRASQLNLTVPPED